MLDLAMDYVDRTGRFGKI